MGKTSLLARFINNVFREDRQATVQAAFMSKQLTIDGQQARDVHCMHACCLNACSSCKPLYTTSGARVLSRFFQQVEVALWDTAGQERFQSLAPLYYRDANAALLVRA